MQSFRKILIDCFINDIISFLLFLLLEHWENIWGKKAYIN